MAYPGPDNTINCVGLKFPIAFIGGTVIIAIMFLAVFVGGANAGDCTRGQSAEAPAEKGHH